MKKYLLIILIILTLLACDLSTSLAPAGDNPEDMSATVNSIMTEFPTIDGVPTKQPTSQPTLMAPLPLLTESFPVVTSSYPSGTFLPDGTQIALGTDQATLAITITPSITPTFSPEDPRSALGPPSWVDGFRNGDNWPQGSDQYTSVKFETGFMKLTALTGTDGWRLTYPNIRNFYLEASFLAEDCKQTDHFGILFRVPDIAAADQGYFYGIQCDGKYFLKVYADKVMKSLVYPKSDSNIHQGKEVVNRLGIMAEGENLSLYVNGILVKEISDAAFSQGGFGIFVGSDVVPDLTVWIDEVLYWTLP